MPLTAYQAVSILSSQLYMVLKNITEKTLSSINYCLQFNKKFLTKISHRNGFNYITSNRKFLAFPELCSLSFLLYTKYFIHTLLCHN